MQETNTTGHLETIAIAGANGRLGRVIGEAFQAAGWRVIAITRSGRCGALEKLENVECRKADAMNAAELAAAADGAGFIFNALNPAYTDWPKFCLPMARNVIAAAKATGAIHLFPGNVYNYGTTIAAVLTPATPKVPDHRKAVIREEMEELFRREASGNAVKTILIRAGDFFGGTGTGSWFDLLIANKVEQGRFTYPGDPEAAHSWAYLPDLAQAFVAIAGKAPALPHYTEVNFAGHTLTGNEMHAAAESAIGQKLRLNRFNWLPVRIGSLFIPMMRELADMRYLWFRPHRLDGTALETITGPLPQTPVQEAVRKSLADIGKPGLRAAA